MLGCWRRTLPQWWQRPAIRCLSVGSEPLFPAVSGANLCRSGAPDFKTPLSRHRQPLTGVLTGRIGARKVAIVPVLSSVLISAELEAVVQMSCGQGSEHHARNALGKTCFNRSWGAWGQDRLHHCTWMLWPPTYGGVDTTCCTQARCYIGRSGLTCIVPRRCPPYLQVLEATLVSNACTWGARLVK